MVVCAGLPGSFNFKGLKWNDPAMAHMDFAMVVRQEPTNMNADCRQTQM
jgi:hypothetical protein